MEYKFLDSSIEKESIVLADSNSIHPILLKNNESEIIKAINFLDSDKKLLFVHGFMGTGKRQLINYVEEYLTNDVVKLEYYCKQATVLDDILLFFNEAIEKNTTKNININAKITTPNIKFKQNISSIECKIIK